jgi:hypothetical protein
VRCFDDEFEASIVAQAQRVEARSAFYEAGAPCTAGPLIGHNGEKSGFVCFTSLLRALSVGETEVADATYFSDPSTAAR